ncbi:MAG: hypothetical protein ACW98D_18185 [Promethearchaeota archaeon]|jgi:hypothetical protein
MARGEKPFIIKRNDTAPALIATIYDKGCLGGWNRLNLSAVTRVDFSMVDDCGALIVSSQSAQTISASSGIIQYNWREGDTAIAGNYTGEFELFFGDGTKMSLPREGGISIRIAEDINNI